MDAKKKIGLMEEKKKDCCCVGSTFVDCVFVFIIFFSSIHFKYKASRFCAKYTPLIYLRSLDSATGRSFHIL